MASNKNIKKKFSYPAQDIDAALRPDNSNYFKHEGAWNLQEQGMFRELK
jgi:hypothetical protein